jgi:hypothetical protein
VRAADARGTAPLNAGFFRVEGGEVHEVAVGPVHAGIIEPGHFRFACAGEDVMHLEIALGYQHRGVEEAIANGPHRATASQIEAVSGDASIAHSTAYASVMEALCGAEAPLRAWSAPWPSKEPSPATRATSARWRAYCGLPSPHRLRQIRGDYLNLTP